MNRILKTQAILAFLLLFMSGCTASGVQSSPPSYSYYEIIDKSQFISVSIRDYNMFWERINARCNARVRQQAQDMRYDVSLVALRGTYNNCMAANNFRRLPNSAARSVANENKEEYGKSYVIEKTWPGR